MELLKKLNSHVSYSTNVLGRDYRVGGVTIKVVDNAENISIDSQLYGDLEESTNTLFTTYKFGGDKNLRGKLLTRVSDSIVFKVIDFKELDTGFELNCKRLGDKHGKIDD